MVGGEYYFGRVEFFYSLRVSLTVFVSRSFLILYSYINWVLIKSVIRVNWFFVGFR